ncbi:hypothetical protein [Argonema galeatum]|uniref:hypothetical protein n=1 Tax=Argonema galeatum TaxID=2942762 RepID=UPI002011DD8E|nr:hypothetical protein [Argonema galeatum]MCL1466081.1 hypothetical protein [Argonema galeatum A003/A1]
MWQKTFIGIAGAAVLILQAANSAKAATFGGVEFPDGAISFTDKVVSYNPVIKHGSPIEIARNTSNALGIPDCEFLSLSCNVSLGVGGSLTLQFTNNILTGSGNNTPDLWIFETGFDVENTFVEISKDGLGWHSLGKASGSTSGIDIDAFGWGRQDLFSYVRLTDDPNQGNETTWLGKFDQFLGADIDAVGAISRALPEPPSVPQPRSVPEPSFVIGLLGLAALGASRRSHHQQKLAHSKLVQVNKLRS